MYRLLRALYHQKVQSKCDELSLTWDHVHFLQVQLLSSTQPKEYEFSMCKCINKLVRTVNNKKNILGTDTDVIDIEYIIIDINHNGITVRSKRYLLDL